MDQQRYSLAHLQANLLGFRGPCGQFWSVICGVAYPLPASASDSLNQQHIRAHLTTKAQGLQQSSTHDMEQDELSSMGDHPNPVFQLLSLIQQYPFNIQSLTMLMLYLCKLKGEKNSLLKMYDTNKQGSDLIFWICISAYSMLTLLKVPRNAHFQVNTIQLVKTFLFTYFSHTVHCYFLLAMCISCSFPGKHTNLFGFSLSLLLLLEGSLIILEGCSLLSECLQVRQSRWARRQGCPAAGLLYLTCPETLRLRQLKRSVCLSCLLYQLCRLVFTNQPQEEHEHNPLTPDQITMNTLLRNGMPAS